MSKMASFSAFYKANSKLYCSNQTLLLIMSTSKQSAIVEWVPTVPSNLTLNLHSARVHEQEHAFKQSVQ